MKISFYDVKTDQKLETEITDKVEYKVRGQVRYAVKAKTSDGRNLTRFVSKREYEGISV